MTPETPAGSAVVARPAPDASTILFLLRAYPDVDHLSPLMWKCLEKGHWVLAVFWRRFPQHETDYRIRFLQRYAGFQVFVPWGATSRWRPVRLAARVAWPRRRWTTLLRRHRVSACCVDWGRSILPGRGWDRVGKALRGSRAGGSFGERAGLGLRLLGPAPLRTSALEAARDLGLPTFCLPHGVLTIVEPDDRVRPVGGPHGGVGLSQADLYGRNAFSAYAYPSELQRELDIRRNKIRPEMTVTWGSLRYSAPWMRIVREICPPWSGPPRQAGRLRLLVLVPKTNRFVDGAGFAALVREILERGDVDLVLKPHPRVEAEAGGEAIRQLRGRPGVWFAIDAHTPALIDQTDAAMVLVSGVSVELLLKGKPLIYPAYLHRNRLVFDDEGGCLRAAGPAEVHRFLDGLVRGEPSPVPQTEVDRVVRRLVYGGRPPYDVPEYYYEQIQRYLHAGRGADPGQIPVGG